MKTRITQRGVIVPILDNLQSPAGIYAITHPRVPATCYIGSSANLQKRAHEHWRDYQQGVSRNLVRLFDAGFDEVQFNVVEYLPADTKTYDPDLLLREEHWSTHYSKDHTLLNNRHGSVWVETQRKNSGYTEKQLLQIIRHHRRQIEYFEQLLASLQPE